MAKILVVDDEEDIRASIRGVLEAKGHTITEAENGDDCLANLSSGSYDLVLLDIMMPGTPVRQVAARIKDTKIVFVSVVRTNEAEKEQLLGQKNVVGFVQKPFDIDTLVAEVDKALG